MRRQPVPEADPLPVVLETVVQDRSTLRDDVQDPSEIVVGPLYGRLEQVGQVLLLGPADGGETGRGEHARRLLVAATQQDLLLEPAHLLNPVGVLREAAAVTATAVAAPLRIPGAQLSEQVVPAGRAAGPLERQQPLIRPLRGEVDRPFIQLLEANGQQIPDHGWCHAAPQHGGRRGLTQLPGRIRDVDQT